MWVTPLFKWAPQGLLVLSFAFIAFSTVQSRYPHRAEASYLGLDVILGNFLLAAIFTAIALSIMPLIVAWAGADPYYSHIGGVVPWSDAAGYYAGAEHLLQTGELDAWSQRRPLNTVFFAVRLAITGNNFYSALVIQAALFGLAGFLSAYSIARTHGNQAGLAMFAILFVFAARYIPTTLSESLGVTFGAISFALLWYGVWRKYSVAYYAGLFFLTFALLSRPGAMLILPTLVIYAGYLFRDYNKFRVNKAALAAFFILIPFLANNALIYLYGDGSGAAFSNFATVLYGLAVGGKGWMQVYVDFPELKSMSEAAASAFIYDRSWAYIIDQPYLILNAILTGIVVEPLRFMGHLARLLFFGSDGDTPVPLRYVKIAGGIFSPLVVWGLVRSAHLKRFHQFSGFLIASWLGVFVSLPFFYFDGKIRTIAAVFPLVAVTIVIALVSWQKAWENNPHDDAAAERVLSVWTPIAFGMLIVSSIFLAPVGFPEKIGRLTRQEFNCPVGQSPLLVIAGPGLPRVDLDTYGSSLANGSSSPSSIPIVPDSNEASRSFRQLSGSVMLLFAYDRVSMSGQYIVAPTGFVGRNWLQAGLCGYGSSENGVTLWKIMNTPRWEPK